MDPMDDIVEPATPELLTVEEASKVMRIGRQLAYDYLASGGTQGSPVIRFGVKCLRVPRWAVLELVSTGNVVRLCDGRVSSGVAGGD
jgi:hypothetical protein